MPYQRTQVFEKNTRRFNWIDSNTLIVVSISTTVLAIGRSSHFYHPTQKKQQRNIKIKPTLLTKAIQGIYGVGSPSVLQVLLSHATLPEANTGTLPGKLLPHRLIEVG